jgi:hypothetical protein
VCSSGQGVRDRGCQACSLADAVAQRAERIEAQAASCRGGAKLLGAALRAGSATGLKTIPMYSAIARRL